MNMNTIMQELYKKIEFMDRERFDKLLEKMRDMYNKTHKDKYIKTDDSSAWDFHYSGHGDYEEERRCFYGDFS